jgi:hypothetical protein
MGGHWNSSLFLALMLCLGNSYERYQINYRSLASPDTYYEDRKT